MDHAVELLRALLPVLYALAAGVSITYFASRAGWTRRTATPLLAVAVGGHLLFLVLVAAVSRSCPLGTVFETMGLVAFALAAVFLSLQIRGGARATGILILPLAFVLVLLSSAFAGGEVRTNPNLKDPWFTLHALSGVIAISALAISFVYGVFYLLLYRAIQRGEVGRLFRRLPPLARLSSLAERTTLIGWGFLTLMIGAGFVWAIQSDGIADLFADPLLATTAGVWLLYAAGLAVRYVAGWRGRYTIYLSVGGFALLLASLALISFLFPSLHEFR